MYQLAVYIHLLAAITWLGGMLFLAAILVPLTRRLQEPPGVGALVLSAAARRFRVVSWVAVLILVGGGIWILLERGMSPVEIITGYGRFVQVLRIKVALVAVVIALSALHDFVLGPQLARRLEAARRPLAGDTVISRQLRMVSWLARINMALTLAIVALGVILVRGTPF